MPRRALLLMLSLAVATQVLAQPREIYVDSKHGNLREAIAHRQVVRLVSEYTLFNWLFTDTVMIDENARPHAFPVLTLNAEHIENDPRALAEFLHGEMRWLLAANETRVEQYITEMLKRPDALVPGLTEDLPPDSIAYIDLLVCTLERQAVYEALGETKLEEIWQWREEGTDSLLYAAAKKYDDRVMGQAVRFRLTLPAR